MLVEYPLEKQVNLIPLFNEHQRLTAIINHALANRTGNVLVDDVDKPRVAWLTFFTVNILAGDSQGEEAREILARIPKHQMILVPTEEWERLLKKTWGKRLISRKRTKFSSKDLDIEHVRKLKEPLADGFTVERIDQKNADDFDEYLADVFFSFYGSKEKFLDEGFGFCIKEGDKIVSAAATGTTPHNKAFEIQVAAVRQRKYRHKGLATVACAYLIEYSLENGYEPRWDADNKISAKFASKLGYADPESYNIYFHTKIAVLVLRKLHIGKIIRFAHWIRGKTII
ncbi:MAG: GNAT family N-acetyltransferase [Candidatus Odinarchaeota archaeon]